MIYIKEESELKLTGLSVIKFGSKTCQPCKRLDVILKKMENEFENIKIYSLELDDFIKLAQKYKILSLPTLLFFNGESEKNKIVGVLPTEDIRKAFKGLDS